MLRRVSCFIIIILVIMMLVCSAVFILVWSYIPQKRERVIKWHYLACMDGILYEWSNSRGSLTDELPVCRECSVQC